QLRSTALARDGEIARVDLALLRRFYRRARREQAIEQQRLHEAQLGLVDPNGIGRREIERAHLDVVDAVLAQRHDGPRVAGLRGLRPDRAVVLVLDLQNVGVQLPVFAADLDADRGIALVDGRYDRREPGDVLVEHVRAEVLVVLLLV